MSLQKCCHWCWMLVSLWLLLWLLLLLLLMCMSSEFTVLKWRVFIAIVVIYQLRCFACRISHKQPWNVDYIAAGWLAGFCRWRRSPFVATVRRQKSRQIHSAGQHASCTTHCVACVGQSPLTWFTNVHLHMGCVVVVALQRCFAVGILNLTVNRSVKWYPNSRLSLHAHTHTDMSCKFH